MTLAEDRAYADQPLPAAAALAEIDEIGATFGNRLAILFAEDKIHIIGSRSGMSAAFSDGRGLFLAPEPPIMLRDDALDDAITLLEQLEQAIATFEMRTGLTFEPIEIGAEYPSGTLWVAVCGARFGFAPERQQLESLPQPLTALMPTSVPVPAKLSFRAASLDMAEAQAIAKGDMLLLPLAAAAAELAVDAAWHNGSPVRRGRWDPDTGQLAAHSADFSAPKETKTMSEDDPASPGSFRVPVSITLPDQPVAAGALQSLAEGGTLSLMPLTEGLQVQLTVAGALIATGEIVKLGERFAVLIDHVPTASPPSEITPEPVTEQTAADAEATSA